MSSSPFRGLVIVAFVLIAQGCDDILDPAETQRSSDTVAPDPAEHFGPLENFPPLHGDIEAVQIERPPEGYPWEEGDDALIAAVREAEGLVSIGFKPPKAHRSRETGVVPEMSEAAALAARVEIEERGAEIVRTFRLSSSVIARIDPGLAPVLADLPIVNYLDPVRVGYTHHMTPPQDTTWGAEKVNAPEAWLRGWGGYYATLTILDSGVDQDHTYDSDGDVEFLRLSDCLYATGAGTSCWDDNDHGSHVIGIATAHDNGYGYIGIATRSSLASVKVCDSNGACDDADITAGLDWTATNGYVRQVVNMSLRHPSTNLLSEYITRSYDAGNLLVAAAGNIAIEGDDPPVAYPAAYSRVIAVSGTMPDDTFADWMFCDRILRPDASGGSRHGPEVELSAPFYALSMIRHKDYDRDCGTSMAAPVVSATAAVVWSQYGNRSRDWVRQRLRETSVDLGSSGWDEYFGYGRVDVARAVEGASLSVSIQGPSSVPSYTWCTWVADVTGGTDPYSYEWYRDYSLVATSRMYEDNTGGSDFFLEAKITDDNGNVSSDGMWVSVGSGECAE